MILPVTGSPLVSRARRETYTRIIEFIWKYPVTPVTSVTPHRYGLYYANEASKYQNSVTASECQPVTTRYKPERIFKLTAIAPDEQGDRVTGGGLAHAIEGGRAR